MSITVRLWSEEELEEVKAGTDPHLTTVFLNEGSYSAKELSYYPIESVHKYLAWWEETAADLVFNAMDDESAKWFLAQEYIVLPDTLCEVITTFRDVEIGKE